MNERWKSYCHLLLRLVSCALLIGTCLDGITYAGDRGSNRVDYAQTIDSLASRNHQPKFSHIESDYRPLFAEDFNWDDQSRVRKALAQLCHVDTEVLRTELANHVGDTRYSITMTINEMDARNYTVGELCRMLLEYQITGPYEDCRVPLTDEKLVYLAVPIDYDKWRKEGLSLWKCN